MSIRDAVTDIAGQLTAAGLSTTGEPTKARAGGAVLFPTRVEYTSLSAGAFHLSLDLFVIGNNRDSTLAVMDSLQAGLDVARATFDATEADAVTLDLAGVSYPALLVPLVVQVIP